MGFLWVITSEDSDWFGVRKVKVTLLRIFGRFIKVINLDRLIENLNTIWIGRFHLFANPVRFERPKKFVFPTYKDMPAAPSNSMVFRQPKAQDHARSYVNVVNGSSTAAIPGPYISSTSSLVLDDSCVVERDLSKYALGKLKDVNSIPNLRTLLMDEGFSNVKLKYLRDAVHDFVSDERIVWVDIEGIPLNVWSRETFMRICKKQGETLDIEDNVDSFFGRKRLCIFKTKQPVSILELVPHSPFSEEVSGDDSESDVEEVSETIFDDNSSSPNNNSDEMGKQHSEDPFKIYDILKKQTGGETREVSSSLSHPPGFTPEVSEIRKENDQGAEEFSSLVNAKVMNNSQKVYQEINRESVDPNVVKEGGLGHKAKNEWIKDEAVENSGGIVCVWEANVFKKDYATILDNFQASCKRVLWAYVSTLIGRWNEETVILGDFNEVRSIDERRGSCFNPSSARVFDHFISSSGLVDVKLEGYGFTWSHPSGSKMSKLDRFLVSDVFDNGLWYTDPGKVKEAFFNHFEARFKKPVAHRFMLNIPFNKWLSDMQYIDLEKNVSRDEIRLAVWNCGENKSPGPDGYTFEFFRKYWNIVDPDFFEVAEYFFETDLFSKDCNSSFVSLIPKVTDAKFVNDFRAISLIGSVYKATDLEWAFYLNEILHWCKRKKKQAMFFKVDFAKAYDSVRWDYLLDVLEAFGFVDEGLFKSVHLQGSISISHLFNADDVMFIEEWSDANLKGLKINIHKSQVLGVRIPRSIVMQAASSIGCGVMHNQFRYLGVMVGECVAFYFSRWFALVLRYSSVVRTFYCFSSGDENETRFWYDKWIGDKSLRDLFPWLFALELDKEVLIADKMKAVVGHSFRRPVRAGSEHQQMVDLNSLLESVSFSQSHDICDERIVWVDIEGIPLNVWSRETFVKIGCKCGETMDIEDKFGSSFAHKRLCVRIKQPGSSLEKFKVILKGKVLMVRAKELFTWNPIFWNQRFRITPRMMNLFMVLRINPLVFSLATRNPKMRETLMVFLKLFLVKILHLQMLVVKRRGIKNLRTRLVRKEGGLADNVTNNGVAKEFSPLVNSKVMHNTHEVHESSIGDSASLNISNNHKGGSIFVVLEDMVREGHSMGYNMEGCMKDIERLGHKTKREWVKELNFKHKVNFLALQETKMDRITHMDVKFMWGNSNFDFIYSESAGNSGGILSIWEASVFKKDYVTVSDNFVAIYGSRLSSNTKILIVVVYAPQQTSSKCILWEYISTLLGRWTGEAIVMGDFNAVRSKDERLGSVFNRSCARLFDNFIIASGLVDVKLEGYKFTWSHPSASKMSKLDLFLVTEGIISLFPSIPALCLDHNLYDHRPILLREVNIDFGLTPFRFFHSWFSLDGFDKMVEVAWLSFSYSDSNRLVRFKKKLQDLKSVIRRWVKDKRLQLNNEKSSLKQELSDIDKDLKRGNASDSVLLKRMELMSQLNDINQLEAKNSTQKSKIHWCSDPNSVKDVFKCHFETRFKKPCDDRLKLNSSFDKRLSPNQLEDLHRFVSRDEIRKAVWSCGDNKSPGPDGFTFEFFRKYWHIVGSDFCATVEHFFDMGVLPEGCKSSFIALIPKVPDAKFVGDFRPICLIGCVYKVITKVLAILLATVISDLVSETQSAFVANRQILDGPFILNEVLNWWIRGSHGFAKASILVNGSPTSEFPFYCGLKQGDHLAPFLFILIMEILHISFTRVVKDGLFKGIQLPGSVFISHIFYADDAMFIGEWSDSNLRCIIHILKCFSLASGLNINIQKSQVLGVGVPHSLVDQAADMIGCSVLSKKFCHHGVMVGESMSRKAAWVDTMHKVQCRLSKWKVKTLSIGGRLTLIKSILGASPLYNMSIFKVPKGVLKTLEAIVVILKMYGLRFEAHSLNQPSIWCSILREVRLLNHKRFDFLSHCKKRVGDGRCTSFWEDIWISGASLRVSFPRLYTLELNKQVSVAEKLGAPLSVVSFRWGVRDGIERQQWSDMVSLVGSVTLSPSKDRWSCELSGDGAFKVKVVRKLLDDMFLPSQPVATRWVKYIPIKVNIFAWRARRDCLPTRSNLNRRGVVLDLTLCPKCSSDEENIHHVLFQCEIAKSVMRKICRWWDLAWQELSSFADWQVWFSAIRLPMRVKLMLEGVFYVAWWRIWLFRNRLIFDNSPPKRAVIFDEIVSFSFNWCSSRCNRAFSRDLWFKNPHLLSL
nr:RNA-directed DNA polymerase, eukaryota [Tanacetum cinerariifolium]